MSAVQCLRGGRGLVHSLVGGVHTVVSPQSQSACSPQLEEEEDHGKTVPTALGSELKALRRDMGRLDSLKLLCVASSGSTRSAF